MNKKQKILIVGAALFAALFLFSGVMMAWQYADGKQSADAFDAVADLIQPVETPQPGTTPGIGDSMEEPDPELIALEKYAAVHEQNSDFVGWVNIDGTNINYPVMQTIDNPNFYLKRGFEKQYSNYGVPYVQENCALGISDNVVIYGHHMNNGSMFADLCKYEREDFYGFGSRVEWCACFVSWCANECGYLDAGVIPKFAGCVNGVQWFKDRGLWQDNNYEPRPGDIIFFDWNDENGQDGSTDHVGIVEKVENGFVYTIEGNSGDSCRERRYSVGYYEIYGYGTPAY